MMGSSLVGKAPDLGSGNREFESRLPNHFNRGLCRCGCGTPTKIHNGILCQWAHGHFQAFHHVGEKSRRQRARNIAWKIIREALERTVSLTDDSRSYHWIKNEIDRQTGPLDVHFSDTSVKFIWTFGYNSEFSLFRHHYRDVINNDKRKLARRNKWFSVNPDKYRESTRKYWKSKGKFSMPRFPKIKENELLVDKLHSLDADFGSDDSRTLYESLSSDQLSPLEELMRKEEGDNFY